MIPIIPLFFRVWPLNTPFSVKLLTDPFLFSSVPKKLNQFFDLIKLFHYYFIAYIVPFKINGFIKIHLRPLLLLYKFDLNFRCFSL